MTGPIDHRVVEAFWADRSSRPSNRWTGEALLEWEVEQLAPFAEHAHTVLDLGSGHGELARSILAPGARLVAVDYAQAYEQSFTEPTHEFVRADVFSFETAERFDLALVYGVVTYVDEEREQELYDRLSGWTRSGGVAIVKHQCSVAGSVVKTGFSEDLGSLYSARYPEIAAQEAALLKAFASVEIRRYPARFKAWPDTEHVAFVCRGPRSA